MPISSSSWRGFPIRWLAEPGDFGQRRRHPPIEGGDDSNPRSLCRQLGDGSLDSAPRAVHLKEPTMLRSITLISVLAAFTLLGGRAEAAPISVSLTKSQVETVCGKGTNYCQKSCGSNGQFKCEFGCGAKGCAGSCLTCPTGARVGNSAAEVVKAIGAALTASAQKRPTTGSPSQGNVRAGAASPSLGSATISTQNLGKSAGPTRPLQPIQPTVR